MAWTAFSAEAVNLDTLLRKLHQQGRVSEATQAIVAALEKAHRDGPTRETYGQLETRASVEAGA